MLRLEGRLAGPWVQEAERCWRTEIVATGPETIEVDLNDVVYIDAPGRWLLSVMHRQGARLQATGCLTRAIVEEVVSKPTDVAAGTADEGIGF